MSQPRILVTGANGQMGKQFREISRRYPSFEFIFLSREDLKIHHFDLVRNFFKTLQPHYCINCAAYTGVDRAEQEKDLAFLVNGEATGVLAAICKEYNTRLIHLSTDYVFDGKAQRPYTEEDAPNPQTVYGASKLEGERQALQFNPDCIIIRTAWVYSEYGKNFVKTILKLMHEKEEIGVVNDQRGSPTYAADLAQAIMKIITDHQLSTAGWKPGIYHFSNEGVISWYEFALAIKEISGSSCKVNPITTDQYPTPAKRPAYSVLDKTKIQRVFGIKPNDWKKSLSLCIGKLQSR